MVQADPGLESVAELRTPHLIPRNRIEAIRTWGSARTKAILWIRHAGRLHAPDESSTCRRPRRHHAMKRLVDAARGQHRPPSRRRRNESPIPRSRRSRTSAPPIRRTLPEPAEPRRPETEQEDTRRSPSCPFPPRWGFRAHRCRRGSLLLKRTQLFTNPNTDPRSTRFDPKEHRLRVDTDVCDDAAIPWLSCRQPSAFRRGCGARPDKGASNNARGLERGWSRGQNHRACGKSHVTTASRPRCR